MDHALFSHACSNMDTQYANNIFLSSSLFRLWKRFSTSVFHSTAEFPYTEGTSMCIFWSLSFLFYQKACYANGLEGPLISGHKSRDYSLLSLYFFELFFISKTTATVLPAGMATWGILHYVIVYKPILHVMDPSNFVSYIWFHSQCMLQVHSW